MKLSVFLVITLLCASCETKQKEYSPQRIGKYLYLNDNGVLHTRSSCPSNRRAKDMDGHETYGMVLIDTTEFVLSSNVSFCTRCFDDALYEQAKSISESNQLMPDSIAAISEDENYVVDDL